MVYNRLEFIFDKEEIDFLRLIFWDLRLDDALTKRAEIQAIIKDEVTSTVKRPTEDTAIAHIAYRAFIKDYYRHANKQANTR